MDSSSEGCEESQEHLEVCRGYSHLQQGPDIIKLGDTVKYFMLVKEEREDRKSGLWLAPYWAVWLISFAKESEELFNLNFWHSYILQIYRTRLRRFLTYIYTSAMIFCCKNYNLFCITAAGNKTSMKKLTSICVTFKSECITTYNILASIASKV